MKSQKYWIFLTLLVIGTLLMTTGCVITPQPQGDVSQPQADNLEQNEITPAAGEQEEELPQELKRVRIAISPFQDVLSLYVGLEKGWFEEVGIDLEVVDTTWPGGGELLVAGEVDLGNAADADVIIQNAQDQPTTFALMLYFFQANAVLVHPEDNLKTFNEFFQETGDFQASMKGAMEQLDGKTICLLFTGPQATSLKAFAESADMTYPDDFNLINMEEEEGLAAFLGSGRTCDAYMGGIPQRLRATKEGKEILVDQSNLPETVIHAGFAANRDWAAENLDTLAAMQAVIYRIQQHILENPEDGFGIIVRRLNALSGADTTVEELSDVWNNIEYFPASAEETYDLVLEPSSMNYWKPRWEAVNQQFAEEGTTGKELSAEEIEASYYVDEVLRRYMELYEPELLPETFGN